MSVQQDQERQMQAYIQWVNSQLRKRPGSRVVNDLQHDMKDGVALLQLIEIVGNEKISIIESPLTISDMSANVTHVLKFMAERKIKMHQINSKEIIEGNKRAIMRLILALAAHFKPGSVRPTNSENSFGKLERASSTMSLAAEAAVALADASQMASSAGLSLHYKYKKRPNFDAQLSTSDYSLNQLPISHSRSSSSASSASQQSTGSIPHQSSTLPRPKPRKKHGDLTPVRKPSLEQSISDTGNIGQIEANMRHHHQVLTKYLSDGQTHRTLPRKMKMQTSKSEGNSRRSSRPSSANSNASLDDHALAEEHDHMVIDVKSLKECLLDLQNMLLTGNGELLNGDDNHDGESELILEGSSMHDQVTMLHARLDQASRDYQHLKSTTSTLKEETVKLQGEKVGLQARLTELEQANMNLRADQLRQELACDSARTAKESAQRTIDERERQIAELHEELAQKDQLIRDQAREIEQLVETITGRENTEADRDTQLHLRGTLQENIRYQIEDLTGRLEGLSDSETQITSQIDHYNRRLKKMEASLKKSHHPRELTKEYDKAYSTLENLRSSFGKHDPRQHALDSITQSLSTMVEKISISKTISNNDLSEKANDKKSPRSRLTPRNRLKNSNTPTKSDLSSSYLNGSTDGILSTYQGKKTKVLYFINQSVTPYLAFINKSLGKITLKDFKNLLDRAGTYRYFFKSVDPDFGSVREELLSDEDILPGWDGKIVSWIEDDKELGPEYRNPPRSTPKNQNHSYVVQKDHV